MKISACEDIVKNAVLHCQIREKELNKIVYNSLLLLLTFLLWGCSIDKMIFYPPERTNPPRLSGQVMLKVSQEFSIVAQFIRASEEKCWILYSHGNATDLYALQSDFADFTRHGYSVAAYDYEGYGRSEGTPSENSAYRDISAVYRYMTSDLHIAPDRIIVYGRSVGSGPACYLAEKHKVGGLVLESPYTTIAEVVTSLPVPFDKFPNIDRIDKIRVPLLIFHGKGDKVIDISHAERLFKKATPPKIIVIIPGAGHNNLKYKAGDIYWSSLNEFIKINLNID